MGVLNVTPDSFSDGGKYNTKIKSYIHAKKMVKYGCDIIDIGAESTRPGALTINHKIEWSRLKHPLKEIYKLNKVISLDTRKEPVMRNALKFNINIINDISGLSHDIKTMNFLKETNLPFVLNHIQGKPSNMQKNPRYKNVVLDVYDFYEKKIRELRKLGICHDNILLDPGIGFGKNLKHNITLLKNISIFHSLGLPIMLGLSRKRFIKDISKENDTVERIGGTTSSCIQAYLQGVQILRVHDVKEINQAFKVFKEIQK